MSGSREVQFWEIFENMSDEISEFLNVTGFGIHSHPYDHHCLNPYNLWASINDAALSWASQLADFLDVEPVITAVSGVGLDSAYGNKPWEYYRDNANPFDTDQPWDYSRETPPVAIVILIGPNDCGSTNDNECPDDFDERYGETLVHYTSLYSSDVPVISVIGGSSSGYNDALVSAVSKATQGYNGDGNVYEILLSKDVWDEINDHKNGNNGCFGHYNEKGHGMVAEDLAPKLREILDKN